MVLVTIGCGDETIDEPTKPAPTAGCPLGEVLDESVCVAIGVPPNKCAQGFEPDGAAGCMAVLPLEPCPAGSFAVPGETSCHEVAPCGVGDWGDIPVGLDTQYVDGAHSGSSNGSIAAPWTTIQQGVDAAVPGAVVAVAAGLYSEAVVIGLGNGKAVTLWGRCPALVEISSPMASEPSVAVTGGASGAEVHGVAVTGVWMGIYVSDAQALLLEHLWIHDTASYGLGSDDVYGAVSVTIRDVLVERASGLGMYFGGDVLVDVERSAIRDTGPTATGTIGRGMDIVINPNDGSRTQARVRHSLIERNAHAGVLLMGTDVTIEATLIRDTLPAPSIAAFGAGILAQFDPATSERAQLTVVSSVVERALQSGIYVRGSDGTIEATVVRDTLPGTTDPSFGFGIAADGALTDPSVVTIVESLVDHASLAGLFASEASMVVERTAVRHTQAVQAGTYAGAFGRGIQIQLGSAPNQPFALWARDSLVEFNHEVGVAAVGAAIQLEAVVVRETAPSPDTNYMGDGIAALFYEEPAHAIVNGCWVVDNTRAGVSSFGSNVTMTGSQLVCNTINLTADDADDHPPAFTDGGGNSCGCGQDSAPCKLANANLTPPTPVTDL